MVGETVTGEQELEVLAMIAWRADRLKPVRRRKQRKKVITNFDHWLNDYVATRQDKENLLKSVREECKAGYFLTKRKGCRLFVDGGADVILELVSEPARFAFIREAEGIERGDLEEDC